MKTIEAFISDDELGKIVAKAIQEDVATGDATVNALIPAEAETSAKVVAKQAGVVAGLAPFMAVFEQLDPAVECVPAVQDGARVEIGDVVVSLNGPSRALLTGERTALNFLGHLSGIATQAARLSDIVAGKHLTILDTRKTVPGLRLLEKYAVQAGGCGNHRIGLFDMIMVKENHLRASGSITAAVEQCRKAAPGIPIEVETTNFDEIREAVAIGADRIMFDNMDNEQIAEALKIVDGKAETEASGNMDEARIKELADSGLDFISVGALTHTVAALDLSMQFAN